MDVILDKLSIVHENEQKVFEAGKKSQHDEFWDDYQNNGTRKNYAYAFAGYGWTKDNLKPKYKVVPLDSAQGGAGMFYRCGSNNEEPIDFSLIADMFDFSNIVYAGSFFESAYIENIIADLSSATNLNSAFTGSWSNKVAKNITIKVSENVAMTSTFHGLIENLTFMEGSVIGKSITVNSKNLTQKSIVNIIEHLSDTASGMTLTLNTNAVNSMTYPYISEDTGNQYDTWNDLLALRENWTISLA